MSYPTRRAFLLGSGAVLLHAGLVRAIPSPRGKIRPLKELQDTVRRMVPEAMRKHGVPGASFALVRDGAIAWAEAFGVRDVETKDPVTPATMFEAASLTKPAYGYAVLKLAEQGKLDLRRPIVEYLDRSLIPADPRFGQITLRHLLSHTSGIEGIPPEGGGTRLRFAPGTRFEYSPHGFDFLQVVVARATGDDVSPLMERMVLRPFGMTASTLQWSEEIFRSLARGYDPKGVHRATFNERFWRMSPVERAKVFALYPLERFPSAAAGLNSTPSDYARFLIEAMKPAGDAYHLGRRMLGDMLKPNSPAIEQFPPLYWGLGFGLHVPRSGPASFWHGGDWGTFQHYAVACRETGEAFVFMSNSGVGLQVFKAIAPVVLTQEQPALQWLTS